MTDSREGQIVTFYSFKGGTGRTMALANVAWILAASGKRVLVVDWDLEAPGLHRFFAPFIPPEFAQAGGVLNLLREFAWATTSSDDRGDGWHREYAETSRYAFSLRWPAFPTGATLDFLPAGRMNRDYGQEYQSLNWDTFYEKLGGGQFLDALRQNMKERYDYTLIDSRTGFSDISDICTVHMPDILVDCFTLSEQSIDGAAQVADQIRARHPRIRVLPVAMRIDPAEQERAETGRIVAMQAFGDLPGGMSDLDRAAYWARTPVPYVAYYAYEETLATFGDDPLQPGTPLKAYETLTGYLTGDEVTALEPMDAALREDTKARFRRRPRGVEIEVTLRYDPADQVWAEWIEHLLVDAGIKVHDPWATTSPAADGPAYAGRELAIMSSSTLSVPAAISGPPGGKTPLAIYLTNDAPVRWSIPPAASAKIAGLSAADAAHAIYALVGYPNRNIPPDPDRRSPRYPATEPEAFQVPARNPNFTGRESDLKVLRASLRQRSAGEAVVLLQGSTMPVALQGMGGIGKTQLAMEYAYRFRSAYDVVWWVTADPPMLVDQTIASIPLFGTAQPISMDQCRVVLDALRVGKPYARWLLIFDNAEAVEVVKDYLPSGVPTGHVLITSRNTTWADQALSLPVEVFQARESVAHLTRRMPAMTREQAEELAGLLQNLPIAEAAAAGYLSAGAETVEEYIAALKADPSRGFQVDDIFARSFDLLQTQSPAAYRLLQLFALMASEVAIELVNSDAVSQVLRPYDPANSEQVMRGRLIQDINKLALLKVDNQAREQVSRLGREQGPRRGQIIVHRAIQSAMRRRMVAAGEDEEARAQVHRIITALRPNTGEVDDPETLPRFRMLWPHLQVSDAARSFDDDVHRLMVDRVRYLQQVGDLVPGRDTATEVERQWTAMLATRAEPAARDAFQGRLLQLRFNLANIHRDLSEIETSQRIDEEVLAQQRELLGPEHPHTLMTAGSLAADMRALGNFRGALAEDNRTYRLWLQEFGEEHPRTLIARNNLATSFRLMGDFNNARMHDQAVYEGRRRVLTDNHQHTLASRAAVGRDLREAGDYQRSVETLTVVAAAFRDTMGEDSRGALNAEANLAVSMRTTGDVRKAFGKLDRAYGQLIELLGPSSLETLACGLSRAVGLLGVNDPVTAQRDLAKIHSIYEQSLGPAHPQSLVCVHNLGAIARSRGQLPQARDLAQTAFAGLTDNLGADHPYARAAQGNLAVFAAEQGELDTAAGLIRSAVDGLLRWLGPDHPDTLRGQANLALILQAAGQGSADSDVEEVHRRLVARVGVDHPAVHQLTEHHYLVRTIDPHPF